MGLFTKKPTYEDAVLFVKHLTEAEYQKFIKVVRTYRGAEKSVQAVLGGKLADYQLEYEPVGEPPKTKKVAKK